ncbi:hypothetical protein [Kushneria phosphatilytica]|uniref:Uncharacterized protein n=1 Tax=Kushneria phosphatilytica TaxID=657387 RepID=A0A1S1NZF9_9GAMM|nr:hypothetical protein [Kushneria phosphatilytica]OHV11175.1 hypothetical protein BH688_07565 [Kushneria phosphatilytica]QEL12256.1 hypothetical protein FY550_14665 [Kushneria phosphatilytica]
MIDPNYQIDPNDSAQEEAEKYIRANPNRRMPHQLVEECGQHLAIGYHLREDEALAHAGYAFDRINAERLGGATWAF